MNTTSLYSLLAVAGGMLSSCVYDSNPVPEMPYRPSPHAAPAAAPAAPAATPAAPAAAPAAQRTVAPAPWATALPGAKPVAEAPAHAKAPAPASAAPKPAAAKPEPKPAPKPAAKASTHITQPAAPAVQPKAEPAPQPKAEPAPAPAPQPAAERKPEPAPAPQADAKADLKKITNDGPIPYATRVDGDPTRVYNPLNPNRTIRIIDKNGNIYPRGKKLRVKGTNFLFYVP